MILLSVHSKESLASFYSDQITQDFLPYWLRAIDETNGGVYTGYDNSGAVLLSTDKYTWSQGRFIWLLARLAEMSRGGMVDADTDLLLRHARRSAEFVLNHALLSNGHCAFLVSAAGEPLEATPGGGLEPSTSADCFVVMGLAEFARITSDVEIAEQALDLYDSVCVRWQQGCFRTEPYPFPLGFVPFSVPMLMLNVTQELGHCLTTLGHARAREVSGHAPDLATGLLDRFVLPSGLTAELLPDSGAPEPTMLAGHFNPGHTIECMWFILAEASRIGDQLMAERALSVIIASVSAGWDPVYGGLFRFVDRSGGEPTGSRVGGRYEDLVTETWDLKLWWPHTEALYATLLAWSVTGDDLMKKWYEVLHRYTFATFPNRDRSVGEWIQIRDRKGQPTDRIAALPVKDPYHILRNMMLIVELLNRHDGSLSVDLTG